MLPFHDFESMVKMYTFSLLTLNKTTSNTAGNAYSLSKQIHKGNLCLFSYQHLSLQCKNISLFMEFLFYYHYFSGWLLKYIYHFYLFIYFCIIFLHTNLPYFVKRPRAIVIDWAIYKYFYYYYYY